MLNLINTFQRLAHHGFYCEVDCFGDFRSIPTATQTVELTAFATHGGFFEFTVLPLKLKVSPGAFQRVMDRLFASVLDDGVLVYFDNIMIYGDCISEIQRRFANVLKCCSEGGLSIRLEKMKLCHQELPCLGDIISRKGIKANSRLKQSNLQQFHETKKNFAHSSEQSNICANTFRTFQSLPCR